jgi:CheY-like chemotaxis protein
MKRKILIIDDDADFAESMTGILENEGYRVVYAHDGTAGLTSARSERPDCILLDVMMTYDSEGIDVAKKLNDDAATKMIPVILTTGIRNAKNLPFSLQADESWLPVSRVLEKPVKPEVLLATVSNVLGAARE